MIKLVDQQLFNACSEYSITMKKNKTANIQQMAIIQQIVKKQTLHLAHIICLSIQPESYKVSI